MPVAAIAAEQLLLSGAVVQKPLIFVADGRIERVATQAEAAAPEHTLHLGSCTLAPAFLDIHVHGAGGCDVMQGRDAIRTTAATLARFGTSRFLATTVTAPVEQTLTALETIADAIEAETPPGQAAPIGIHLEGPFLSHAKRGVHPVAELQPPSVSLFQRFYEAARGHVSLLTIAPELEGANELIAHAAALGVRISLGHSNATAAQTRQGLVASRRAAAAQGVSATHTFNAMRAFDHREVGILGVVLDDRDVYAELICDGIHTMPEAVRLWYHAKGADRAVLVTDGMAAMGMPEGEYKLGGLDVTVRDGVCMSSGVLAGSVLTMERAVANVQAFTGATLASAIRLATHNPSTLLGLPHPEQPMLPGSPADLTIFDADHNFRGTIVRGIRVDPV